MNSLLLSCHGFLTTASGTLRQNYFWQSRPLQNIPTAHHLMNSPMDRWIAALSHLRHCLRFRVCLSQDQHEHNSERELLVPLFLHGLDIGAASVTDLTVFPSANLRGARRSSKCLAVCFIELLIFGPGKGLRIWKGWACSSSRLGVLISDFGLT